MRKLSLLTLILLFSLCQVGCRSKRAVIAAPALEVTDTIAGPPAPLELLAKILDNLRDVHTARYKFVKKSFYGVEDTVYFGNKNGEMIECECPADTFGVSLHVINNLDGTFRNAYTMDLLIPSIRAMTLFPKRTYVGISYGSLTLLSSIASHACVNIFSDRLRTRP